MPLKSEIMQNAKKQHRLKRKLLMQRQASTSTETELDEKQKKAEYDEQYRMKRKLLFLTYDMSKSSLRHIHDPVLSSLKMKGIRLFFIRASKTLAINY
jgi:hypothetical protein